MAYRRLRRISRRKRAIARKIRRRAGRTGFRL